MNVILKNKEQPGELLVEKVRGSDKQAFKVLFFRYYDDLCRLAAQVTKSSDRSRDVVQEVFLRLWRNRKTWQVNSSLRAYLHQAVWNEALNTRKKGENQRRVAELTAEVPEVEIGTTEHLVEKKKQLVEQIWQIVSEMPERRRYVFTLHRKHGLSYREIAQVMNISPKTVENHMGLALKEIRRALPPSLLA